MIRALPLLAAVVLAAAGPVVAASFSLEDGDRKAAIHAGERSTLIDGYDREWRVSGDGGEVLTVLTPFHRLLLASRSATFKNDPLKPPDVDRVLKQDSQRLIVWATLRGRTEDFARHFAPRLTDGAREIRPTFVQNERTAIRQEDGVFLARCVYGFPIRDINGQGRVELTVADADGKDVSHFVIDLGRMR
ncbi:MAG TPA: hypothetical protein VHT71_10590 [Methylomirabilota bacterium]|nr:hypothetical protein [Methylomirabilota bacterium]